MNKFIITACLLAGLSAEAAVKITTGPDNTRTIAADAYTASVATDGCLTNLRIGGAEFLKPGVSISRGTYFHQNGPQKLTTISQPDDHTITASNDKAAITYDFAPAAMTWTVNNKTAGAMQFFLIFDPTVVNAVMNDKGDTARPAVANNWQKTIWFAGKNRLEVTGSTKLWGPWAGPYQVWDATLKPNETRKIEFKIGQATDAEAVKVAKAPTVAPAPASPAPAASAPAKPPVVEKPATGTVSGTALAIDLQGLTFKLARDGDPNRVLVYNVTLFTDIVLNGKTAKLEDIKKGMKVKVTSDDGKDAGKIEASN